MLHQLRTVFSNRHILPIALLLLSLCLTGCTGSSEPAASPDTSATHTAPENAARVFVEALYTGNSDKLLGCFPEDYVANLSDSDRKQYAAWAEESLASLTSADMKFLGTTSQGTEDISEDSDDYKRDVADISLAFGIPSDGIDAIRTVQVRIFCQISGDKKYQDIPIITFKMGNSWYVSTSQDSSLTTSSESETDATS